MSPRQETGFWRHIQLLLQQAFSEFKWGRDVAIGACISIASLLLQVQWTLVTSADWKAHKWQWLASVIVPSVAVILIHIAYRLATAPWKVHQGQEAQFAEEKRKMQERIAQLEEELKAARIISPSQRASIVMVRLSFPDDPFTVGATFHVNLAVQNIGPAPANKVTLVCRIGIVPSSEYLAGNVGRQEQEDLFQKVKAQLEDGEVGNNSIQPGKQALVSPMYPLPVHNEIALTPEDIDAIKHKRRAIAIAGIMRYVDVYGARETHMFYTFHGEDFNMWHDGFTNNEIIDLTTLPL